jgi:hypothetical protein
LIKQDDAWIVDEAYRADRSDPVRSAAVAIGMVVMIVVGTIAMIAAIAVALRW